MLIAFSPARDATMKTYKQLTYEQQCQIYALKRIGMSQNKIAKQLNVNQLLVGSFLVIQVSVVIELTRPNKLQLNGVLKRVKRLK